MGIKEIAVIGGGPAGMMAAIMAARQGAKVTLFEKNDRLGKKLRITGKGRCNVTNSKPQDEFFKSIRRNGRFLYSSFAAFDNQKVMDFFEELGVPLKVERGDRVFPQSDRANDIAGALEKELRSLGVELKLGYEVKAIAKVKNGFHIVIKGLANMPFDAVIIATGGVSYSATGSTGDGYRFANALGIPTESPRGALVPLVLKASWLEETQGLSLRNVKLTIKTPKGKKVGEDFGEMLFTHYGISGPIVLSLSGNCADYWQKNEGPLKGTLDLKPALSEEKLEARLLREIDEQGKKAIQNAFKTLLPQSLIPVVLQLAVVDGHKAMHDMTKKERQAILQVLKQMPLEIVATRPVKEAIVTIGGVRIKALNPKTMMAKEVPGLFFAGEVIDLDAYTGGYNLQIAFSTGAAAGRGAVDFITEENE